MKTNVIFNYSLGFFVLSFSGMQAANVTLDLLETNTESQQATELTRSIPIISKKSSQLEVNDVRSRTSSFLMQPGLRKIASESKTASFNEMLVRHAKRLCNSGLCRVFPHDGRDFIDFWHTANEVNLDVFKAYECMRLFGNNIKSCEVIDNTVIEQILSPLSEQLSRYFDPISVNDEDEVSIIQRDDVEDLLLGKFTEQLDQFQSSPDLFLSRLSNDIVKMVKSQMTIIKQEQEEKEFKEKLRMSTVRLLDTVLGKSIWYTQQHETIWSSFISVADKLHALGLKGIIDDQDYLDELWDSHTRRFVWYLDFKGQSLPISFYEQIEADLKNKVVFFLEAGEQDEGIVSKKEMIIKAVAAAKAKSIAYEKGGLITGQIG